MTKKEFMFPSCFSNFLPFCSDIQGKTVEVGRAHFETENTRFTILDAPVSFSVLFLFLIRILLRALHLVIPNAFRIWWFVNETCWSCLLLVQCYLFISYSMLSHYLNFSRVSKYRLYLLRLQTMAQKLCWKTNGVLPLFFGSFYNY